MDLQVLKLAGMLSARMKSGGMEELLLKDKDFQQDETDLAEMERRFREMELSEKTRRFVEDYVACMQSRCIRMAERCFT